MAALGATRIMDTERQDKDLERLPNRSSAWEELRKLVKPASNEEPKTKKTKPRQGSPERARARLRSSASACPRLGRVLRCLRPCRGESRGSACRVRFRRIWRLR